MPLKMKKMVAIDTSHNPHVRVSHYDIVIANDDQKDCLEIIRDKNICVGRCICMFILEEVGIVNELIEIVNRMKWGKLFVMRYDAYENLVYEFYSSLKLRTDT